jgi:hypothetical protein
VLSFFPGTRGPAASGRLRTAARLQDSIVGRWRRVSHPLRLACGGTRDGRSRRASSPSKSGSTPDGRESRKASERSGFRSRKGSAAERQEDKAPGGRKFDLRAIDANSEARGNQSFVFIGSREFSDKARELNYRDGVISGDTDGDGRADFQISLANEAFLRADDFLL